MLKFALFLAVAGTAAAAGRRAHRHQLRLVAAALFAAFTSVIWG